MYRVSEKDQKIILSTFVWYEDAFYNKSKIKSPTFFSMPYKNLKICAPFLKWQISSQYSISSSTWISMSPVTEAKTPMIRSLPDLEATVGQKMSLIKPNKNKSGAKTLYLMKPHKNKLHCVMCGDLGGHLNITSSSGLMWPIPCLLAMQMMWTVVSSLNMFLSLKASSYPIMGVENNFVFGW